MAINSSNKFSKIRYSLLEYEYLSPLLDNIQENCDLKIKKYFILSPPRSGSYYLCRFLFLNKLGIPFEYFNPLFLGTFVKHFFKKIWFISYLPRLLPDVFFNFIKKIDSIFFANKLSFIYLEKLVKYRSWNGNIFGLKLQNNDIKFAKRLIKKGWVPIFLERKEINESIASYHYSLCTGHWDDRLNYTYSSYHYSDLYSIKKIQETKKNYLLLRNKIKHFKSDLNKKNIFYLDIDFKDLINKPEEFLKDFSFTFSKENINDNFVKPNRDQMDFYTREIKKKSIKKILDIILN